MSRGSERGALQRIAAPSARAAFATVDRFACRYAPRLRLLCGEPRRATLGLLGESLALAWLARRGQRTLARNVVRPEIEIDLLLADGATLVVCEVKTARSHGDLPLGGRTYRPAHRVDRRRVERLLRAARGLARTSARATRVDLVEVWIRGPRRSVEYAWHRGLAPGWEPPT